MEVLLVLLVFGGLVLLVVLWTRPSPEDKARLARDREIDNAMRESVPEWRVREQRELRDAQERRQQLEREAQERQERERERERQRKERKARFDKEAESAAKLRLLELELQERLQKLAQLQGTGAGARKILVAELLVAEKQAELEFIQRYSQMSADERLAFEDRLESLRAQIRHGGR